ncbi:nuclear transport factor 2 family protein [Luteimonas panaciterrae]|uniref:nuclear transport factor 2 family protein n=1 Tax=Luteimonas panaciterrae TaxID=363885 RepID=UPI001CFC0470|nr:nuclear transport factor 2 family protein [Luteimonas panaciterrae]
MKQHLLPIVCAIGCFLAPIGSAFAQNGAAQGGTTQKQQVEAVIEAFRTSIIEKDKAKFTALLFSEDIPWTSVVSEETLARTRKKKPEAKRVYPSVGKGPIEFIDSIVAEKEPQEEKFENVRIETDGSIASVWFDYSYHDGAKKTNWGKEAWQLVRTDDGWKINSVIWSMTY